LSFEVVERDDGTLVLPTNADPAGAGHQKVGFRRLSVALDVGGRGDDPSAMAIIRAESRPYLTGTGWEQRLTPPRYTVVWTETAKLAEATDVVDWSVSVLRKLRNWRFSFDATGMGAPLESLFAQAKVAATPFVMTAGATFSRDGARVRVSKNLLFENAATCLENGTLTIASDLPERDALLREIQSVEFAQTSAGNLTLQGGGRGHHADRFVAMCLALFAETHTPQQRVEVVRLRGYYG
jgi:hypothetical protein